MRVKDLKLVCVGMPTTGASIIIGVMGVTGSGKSAFVQRVTQNQDVGVSGGIDSGR